MKFSILTLFPEMVSQGLDTSIIGRAVESGLLEIQTVNIRDYTHEKHGKVDDYTYGGGAGMLMQAQPVFDAWKSVSKEHHPRTIYVTPQGRRFDQRLAGELAKEEELVILCGHYEGIDERVLEETVTDYISIGDYVLTGGELAAMVIVDAVSRLVPGVLGNETSADTESFHGDLLEYPQYSRPEIWHGKKVPEVLLSGDHKKIGQWRLEQSVERTMQRRPDLYERYELKRKVIKRLSKKKRDNIHIIESLSRGNAELLYENGENILVYDSNCKLAIMTVDSPQTGEQLLMLLPNDVESFEISQDFMIPVLEKKLEMHVIMQCVNACYTNKEQMPIKHKDIRVLTEENLDYVVANYDHAEPEYLKERIKEKQLFGAFADDKLVGFAGEHEEGSIGMLFVEPEYRGIGIGSSLEAFCINRHKSYGFLPFGQIEVQNAVSMKLQEKCGLYLSKGFVWWLFRTEKWEN